MTHFTILASSCAGVGVMISAYSWHNIIECRRHWFGSNHSQQSLRFAKPILSFCGLCIYEDDCNVRLPHCDDLQFAHHDLASCSSVCSIPVSVGRISWYRCTNDEGFLALLYYDYVLTFPAEVKHIWSRRITVSTLLYICCRYALLANLLYLFAISNVINQVNLAVTQ